MHGPSTRSVWPEIVLLHRFLSWDDYFMAVAFLSAQRSKDPNKQVTSALALLDFTEVTSRSQAFCTRGIEVLWAQGVEEAS